MILKYDIWVNDYHYDKYINRIINQVYKLLPLREEGKDWEKPLQTLIEQMAGLQRLVDDQDQSFLTIMAKMEGLLTLIQTNDFERYRNTIFECLNLLSGLKINGKDSKD